MVYPLIPKEFVMKAYIDSNYIMQSVGLVYYTPTYQMKVANWEDFENLGKGSLKSIRKLFATLPSLRAERGKLKTLKYASQ